MREDKRAKFRAIYSADLGHNVVSEFLVPALEGAVEYKRVTGDFSSAFLVAAARGLSPFFLSGGKMQLVTNGKFSANDKIALLQGTDPHALIEKSLLAELEVMKDLVTPFERDHLKAFVWLLKSGRLEMKVSLKKGIDGKPLPAGDFRGEQHGKVGIIQTSDSETIVFLGGINESMRGYLGNADNLTASYSWRKGDQEAIAGGKAIFDALWRNQSPASCVYNFPEACKRELIATYDCDAPPSLFDTEAPSSAISRQSPEPRNYQIQAIRSWLENSGRGILKMATGTGKTKTALFGVKEVLRRESKVLLVVVAPYKHLTEQWAAECALFGWKVVQCSSDYSAWPSELSSYRLQYAMNDLELGVAIVTYDTFSSSRFQSVLNQFHTPMMLVADEVHHLGAANLRIPVEQFKYRLGLSATPERVYDAEGTAWLLANIGPVVYRFEMKDAIPDFLTPYDYHIHLVRLTSEEAIQYANVIERIREVCARGGTLQEENPDHNLRLGPLLRERAEIIGGAENKIREVRNIVSSLLSSDGPHALRHTLFYVGSKLFDTLLKVLSDDYGLKVSQFTFTESRNERKGILESFAQGRIDSILAKRCLDEGVDVPATRSAFILASSSNPMEFIQRRGRVLRKWPGKDSAAVHDFFVLPPDGGGPDQYDRILVERELRRSIEFAHLARNSVACAQQLHLIKKFYNLLHL